MINYSLWLGWSFERFISQCPESFHGRIVMHCRNIVNRVQIAHVKQPIAHVNDIFPIGNFALDIKCMNCIQSLWRLMYFKCFDTSGNISDIYRTKHWSSCVICAIFNIDINVFRLCGFINCQLGCTTHCLINIRHGVIMKHLFGYWLHGSTRHVFCKWWVNFMLSEGNLWRCFVKLMEVLEDSSVDEYG